MKCAIPEPGSGVLITRTQRIYQGHSASTSGWGVDRPPNVDSTQYATHSTAQRVDIMHSMLTAQHMSPGCKFHIQGGCLLGPYPAQRGTRRAPNCMLSCFRLEEERGPQDGTAVARLWPEAAARPLPEVGSSAADRSALLCVRRRAEGAPGVYVALALLRHVSVKSKRAYST